MRKKMLSLALALVMCLGLTVPAFASGLSGSSTGGSNSESVQIWETIPLTLDDVTFSVDPVGIVTIQFMCEDGSAYSPLTAYMFDQPVSVSMKDGRIFTEWIQEEWYMNEGRFLEYFFEISGVPDIDKDTVNLNNFNFIEDHTYYVSPYMVSKSYVDSLIEGGHKVDIQPYTAGQSSQPSEPAAPRFTDVKADAFYAGSVAWAVEQGITTGTSATTFSPNDTCTQGQILTFLWRAKGEPKPAGTVSGTKYYAAAAQWAKEQGLTDTFSGDADCTRSMVVTYLWKLAGSPKTGTSNFHDVSADAAYAPAVAWAVEQGITSGTSTTTFSPDTTCTRGQIVTFLYRALVK